MSEIPFRIALAKHIADIEHIQKDLNAGKLSIAEAADKLRKKSIELGTISCMPFRDTDRSDLLNVLMYVMNKG